MWLTNATLDNEILPVNYSIYRADRDTRGGGVLLAVKNTIPSQLVNSPKDLELVTISLGLNNPVTVCLVYNSPNSSSEYKQSLVNYFQSVIAVSSKLILMGNFNVPGINWATLSGSSTFQINFVIWHSSLTYPNLWINLPTFVVIYLI